MSWKDRPTVLNHVRPKDYYVFIDESGSLSDHATMLKKVQSDPSSVPVRDSTFSINAIFMTGGACFRAKKIFDELKAKYFGRNDFLFHNREITGHQGTFASIPKLDEAMFEEELTKILPSLPFKRAGFGVNKKFFFAQMVEAGCLDSITILKAFFSTVFKRIDKLLGGLDIEQATLVFEESTQEIDGIIVKILHKLVRNKTTKHLKGGVYFVKKSMEQYPAGAELADLGSASVYKFFQNTEFFTLLPKTIGFSQKNKLPYELISYKRKKPTGD